MTAASEHPASVGRFAVWAVIGLADALGFVGIASIGIFVLAFSMPATVVMLIKRGIDASTSGVLAGAGFIPLYVGWLNRDGPGEVCTTTPTSQSCISEFNPWPWFVIGTALLTVGVALFVRRRCRQA